MEIDNARLERYKLEQELRNMERSELSAKQSQMVASQQYGKELLQQAREIEERRIRDAYALTDVEKALNHQYLSPVENMNPNSFQQHQNMASYQPMQQYHQQQPYQQF